MIDSILALDMHGASLLVHMTHEYLDGVDLE